MISNKPVVIIGNGGHSKVLSEILLIQERKILGFTSPKKEENTYNLQYLGDDSSILSYSSAEIELVNGIGSTQSTLLRKEIFKFFKGKGYHFTNVIHPTAILSEYSIIGEGVQIMAGSVIQPFAEIADNTIVNTSVSIDHDCNIGKHCHVAPGTIVSGTVTIGDSTHIGTGTTIVQNVEIGKNVLIGAGSLVLKNIKSNSKAYGVPAKEV